MTCNNFIFSLHFKFIQFLSYKFCKFERIRTKDIRDAVLARSINDEYARKLALHRGNYVVIGRGSNKTAGYREHIVYNVGGEKKRRETHRGESSPRTISRRSILWCVFVTGPILSLLFFLFCSFLSLSLSSSRSCFFSHLLSPFPLSSLLSIRRRG